MSDVQKCTNEVSHHRSLSNLWEIISVCIPILVTTFPEWLSHCRSHPAPCVRPLMFVVFCVHMHSFAGLIRRTPPPKFSDTAITDRHSDTTIFQLRAHWVRISWIGKIIRTCAAGGSRTLDFLRSRRAPYPLGQALLYCNS